ncbi:Adenylate cyclase type 10 [Phlyctochytrium planicorne]|nr:Adenylate cyclase type 10 [Phlyctochytrium planicorne]
MRLESLLAQRLRIGKVPNVPSAEAEHFGCVAVIDISGYTQLTDQLAALGGIDRIKDVLNPPFETIIDTVHKFGGSVVKLAGDSAIVVWTVTPLLREQLAHETSNSEANHAAREVISSQAILSCMELLELFEDYTIQVSSNVRTKTLKRGNTLGRDDSEKGKQRPANDSQFSTAKAMSSNNGRRGSLINAMSGNSSSEEFSASKILLEYMSGGPRTNIEDQNISEDKHTTKELSSTKRLRLHIGMGFGKLQHVFAGTTTTTTKRAEYFVAGKALLDAGSMLNMGKSGQLVFHEHGLDTYSFWFILQKARNISAGLISIDTGLPHFNDLKTKLHQTSRQDHMKESGEGQTSGKGFADRKLIPFIEPSLTKHLLSNRDGNSLSSDINLAGQENSAFSDNMDQYRTITTLFLRFPNIPVDRIGVSQRILQDVEFIASEAITVVSRHGGSCRQIHADEKALSVLLVWGIEGFSHEKGDHGYALAAGIDLEKVLNARKWWWQDPERDSEHVPAASFSLALTMGKAFSGFIGTENRSEGTVLGPSVNLAARIMCNPACNGRLLCDRVISEACDDIYDFKDMGTMKAKGIEGEIQLFAPTGLKANDGEPGLERQLLEGRVEELSLLSSTFEKWMAGERAMALVTGKSGQGKTHLVKSFLGAYEDQPDVFVCMASARESRNDSNYIFQQVLVSMYVNLTQRGWTSENIKNSVMGRRKMSMASSFFLRSESRADTLATSYRSSITLETLEANSDRVAFFASFGIGNSNLLTLLENYPSVFGEAPLRKENVSSSDPALILVSLLTSILKFLDVIKLKAVILLDDAQWMDSGSFETTLDIIQRFQNVMVVLTSRPKEEYNPNLKCYFDRLISLPICEHLALEKLTNHAIEKLVILHMRSHNYEVDEVSVDLLEDIVEKSQGNPMVIKLVCNVLSASPAVVVRNGCLVHLHGKSRDGESITLPMDASAAIVSMLDKLPSNVQMILRVASVAAELVFCLHQCNFEEKSPDFENKLPKLIQKAQAQGIIAINDDSNTIGYSFHHYLIYQGIYQSILQSRREELHRYYSEYYEDLYLTTSSMQDLSTLLHHLLKIPGEERKKKRFVKMAFKISSDIKRPVEGRMYHEIMTELDQVAPEQFVPLDKAIEYRLLGLVERESGNYMVAQCHFERAAGVLGLKLPKKGKSQLPIIGKVLHSLTIISRLQKLNVVDRCILSILTLTKFFPIAFQNQDVKGFCILVKRNKQRALEQYVELMATVEEIRQLSVSFIALAIAFGRPGLDTVLLQFFLYFALTAIALDESNQKFLAIANTATGVVFSSLGKIKVCAQMFSEAEHHFGRLILTEESDFPLLFNFLMLFFAKGDLEACIPVCYHFLDLSKKVYALSARATLVARLILLVSETVTGRICQSLDGLMESLKNELADCMNIFEGQEVQMYIAAHYVSLGRLQEGFCIYDARFKDLEVYMADNPTNANGWRVMIYAFFRCQIELAKLSVAATPEDRERLCRSLIATIRAIIAGAKTLTVQQPMLSFSPLLMFIPTLIDMCQLLYSHAKVPSTKEYQKSLRKMIQKVTSIVMKGGKVFPSSFQFTKNMKKILMMLSEPSSTSVRKSSELVLEVLSGREKLAFLHDHVRDRLFGKVAALGTISKNQMNFKWSKEPFERALAGLTAAGLEREAAVLTQALGSW